LPLSDFALPPLVTRIVPSTVPSLAALRDYAGISASVAMTMIESGVLCT
jgi:hypothetical protein